MTKRATVITVSDFVLCATNEGAIYQSNLACAYYTATLPKPAHVLNAWLHHLRNVIVPALTRTGGSYADQRIAFGDNEGARLPYNACELEVASALATHYTVELIENAQATAGAAGWTVVRDGPHFRPVGPGGDGHWLSTRYATEVGAWNAAAAFHGEGVTVAH